MEIASHHAEGERVAPGIHMEKRLLLDRVALQRRRVTKGHSQLSALIETHLANAASAFPDQTAMATGKAADAVAFDLPECTDPRVAVEPAGERFVRDARFRWTANTTVIAAQRNSTKSKMTYVSESKI